MPLKTCKGVSQRELNIQHFPSPSSLMKTATLNAADEHNHPTSPLACVRAMKPTIPSQMFQSSPKRLVLHPAHVISLAGSETGSTCQSEEGKRHLTKPGDQTLIMCETEGNKRRKQT